MRSVVKILKHGIRHNGKYHRCFYSTAKLCNFPEGTITVYAWDYESLPVELAPVNNSDSMTDYFETDKVRIVPTHPLYSEFLKQIERKVQS